MRSRCALLLLGLSACSGEEDASPPAPAPAAQSAPAPAAQPAPPQTAQPAPAAPAEPTAPAVTISTLKADASPGVGLAVSSSEESASHPISRTVRSHMADLKRCQTRPGTPADVRLVLGFSIAPSGRLTALDVKSTDRAVAECIAPLAAAWSFDPPLDAAGKPTSATYQFPVYLTTQR